MIALDDNILKYIPQRPPFVMIDGLTGHDPQATNSRLLIKADNIFVVDGKFTEPGLVENIAQTAAARAGFIAALQQQPVRVGYIGAIKNLVIYQLPKVSDELRTMVLVQHQVFEVTLVKGEVYCNGNLVAEVEMKIFITNQNK